MRCTQCTLLSGSQLCLDLEVKDCRCFGSYICFGCVCSIWNRNRWSSLGASGRRGECVRTEYLPAFSAGVYHCHLRARRYVHISVHGLV